MSFNLVTTAYVRELQQVYRNAIADDSTKVELKSRPGAHRYLEKVWDIASGDECQLSIRHETRVTGTPNTPDWRIEDSVSHGVFFYGDHKSTVIDGPYVPSGSDIEQIERYLKLGRPLFVFDGIEFLFYETASIHEYEVIELIPKPLDIDTDWSRHTPNPAIEVKFRHLLKNPGFSKWTEEQLITHVATRAKMLSDAIYILMTRAEGSGETINENDLIQILQNLHQELREHHDPSLAQPRACADFVAQVLAFGLFFAHTQALLDENSPELRRSLINAFWSNKEYTGFVSRLRPFVLINATLSDQLDRSNEISRVYRELSEVLAHAEYLGTDSNPRNYHALFEQFFKEFNSVERFERGAFYTPEELTDWMVSLVDSVCRKKFKQSLQESAERIVDPCCGTGGFIESLVNRINYQNESVVPHLIGLEVLPAPYVLSHVRLAQSIKSVEIANKIQLFLVDTLSDQFEDPPSAAGSVFGDELNSAAKLAKPDLRIIIGNPPSTIRSSSKAARHIIEDRMETFRPPRRDRTDRQNVQKALNNDAFRFLRWSCEKILKSKKGIVALVLPNTFLHKVSFKYARTWLLEQFEDIWILNLDKDARTGSRTESLFDVLQGRAVLVAVYDPINKQIPEISDSNGEYQNHEIEYLDISDYSRRNKIEYLRKEIELTNFSRIPVSNEQRQFAPTTSYPKDIWANCWPLVHLNNEVGIFQSKCSGVKLSPSSLLFHTDAALLTSRCNDVGQLHTLETSYDDIIRKWFMGQKRIPKSEKLTPQVCDALAETTKDSRKNYRVYSYRPFLEGLAVYDSDVFKALALAPGDGTRPRRELGRVFEEGGIGIGISPDPTDLGNTLTRFASFCWNLPDNDLAARGNSMIYANLVDISENEEGRDCLDLTEFSNISSGLSKLFNEIDESGKIIMYYVYAVLSSTAYLDIFEGALFRSADPNRPIRIPIFKNASVRRRISHLGFEIARCENREYRINNPKSYLVSKFETQDEFLFTKYFIDVDSGIIKLYENGYIKAQFDSIPTDVLELRISGHDVIRKWLREREYRYLRRTFRLEDIEALSSLINRVCRQCRLLSKVDKIIYENLIDIESAHEMLVEPINVGV